MGPVVFVVEADSGSAKAIDSLVNLISLSWNKDSWNIDVSASIWLLIVLVGLFTCLGLWRWWSGSYPFSRFEIDEAEIGVGASTLRFRPNLIDRQVAYAIWVELSTRKIGLPIDFQHDVISEVYDSWYTFFSVTRELVKGIPVSKVKRDSTQAIIKLSIEVLNEGLRPHLTKWQAPLRHWYDRELRKRDAAGSDDVIDPQQLQEQFPRYEELKSEMKELNERLMRYRKKMRELVLKD